MMARVRQTFNSSSVFQPDSLFSIYGGTVAHIVIYLLNIQRKCEVVDANWGVTSLKVPSQDNGEGTTQVYTI